MLHNNVFPKEERQPSLFSLPPSVLCLIRCTAGTSYLDLHDQDWVLCCRYGLVHHLNHLAFSNSTRNLPGGLQALSASFLKWISSLLLVWGMCLKESQCTEYLGLGCLFSPTLRNLLLLTRHYLKMGWCFLSLLKTSSAVFFSEMLILWLWCQTPELSWLMLVLHFLTCLLCFSCLTNVLMSSTKEKRLC